MAPTPESATKQPISEQVTVFMKAEPKPDETITLDLTGRDEWLYDLEAGIRGQHQSLDRQDNFFATSQPFVFYEVTRDPDSGAIVGARLVKVGSNNPEQYKQVHHLKDR